jgi:hypothetical protein
MLEKHGVPEIVAGLGVLIVSLIALDTFNNRLLGQGTLNNPSNSAALAAAGKGSFTVHIVRIVSAVLPGMLRIGLQIELLAL